MSKSEHADLGYEYAVPVGYIIQKLIIGEKAVPGRWRVRDEDFGLEIKIYTLSHVIRATRRAR